MTTICPTCGADAGPRETSDAECVAWWFDVGCA